LSTDKYIPRFLLVSLNIDAILQGTTIGLRRRKLNAMTDGLGLEGAYGETLSRIKGQGEEESRLGMATLMWISHAKRPLKAEDLRYALGLEIESPDLDGDNVPSIETLLACCQGLVAVDKEASTIRLIHFTLQEYLQAHAELFDRPHATMAETCLSYLNSRQIKVLSGRPPRGLRGTAFLEYSSLYWGVHAKRDLSDCAKQLALKLFDDYSSHISTEILLEEQEQYYSTPDPDTVDLDPGQSLLFTGLHCASFFGIVEIVTFLVEVGDYDINKLDDTWATPLMWAARNGHEGVVKMLLKRDDVSPDEPNWYDETPLFWAAANGHEGVAKLLLDRDNVSPDKPHKYGQTPLWHAASNGHEGVVKLLLGRDDVNPNKPDVDGVTPLWYAAWNGHEGVVKLLLGRDDINPDQPDDNGQTALWRAASNGHEGVVKLLLGRDDINPDQPNVNGRTALWRAASNGHEGVVKLLLGRDDINPNKPDVGGETPLWRAASSGHEGVVKLLLGRDDINPNKPDVGGEAPLWRAASNGHEGVVKLLLGRDDINPNEPDVNGVAPLWRAASNGHEGVVKLLLGRSDINPDKPDIKGQTLLS